MKRMILKSGKLVTAEGVRAGDLTIENGTIRFGAKPAAGDDVVDLGGKYVLPGFVEFHFHGYNLFDFTQGLYDLKTRTFNRSEEVCRQGFDMLRRELPRFGVTGFYMGSSAVSIEKLRSTYRMLRNYMDQPENPAGGARLWGSLNEGSFINSEMAGAQNPANILKVSREIFDQMEDRGCIKLINVVPDFGAPAVDLTEYLTKKGIIVGAGHTKATFDQFTAAVKAGLKYCIHFTNGPTGGSYKPFNGGGAVEAVLSIDSLYAELIVDGFHVNPAYIRDIIKRKGIDKIIAVSDSLYAAGSELKEFEEEGIKARLSANGQYFEMVGGAPNALAGSNVNALLGCENLINWLTRDMAGIWNPMHDALGLDDAMTAISQFYSTNPNTLTGMAEQGYGRIADGAKADLCVLDINGSPGNYLAAVEMTFVDGQKVYNKT
jgi:N-acetylglucosamine-6-phosphate deacetylase